MDLDRTTPTSPTLGSGPYGWRGNTPRRPAIWLRSALSCCCTRRGAPRPPRSPSTCAASSDTLWTASVWDQPATSGCAIATGLTGTWAKSAASDSESKGSQC